MTSGGRKTQAENSGPVSSAGKMRLANVLDADQFVALAKVISNNKSLLRAALTDKISDRETFMKGIDYSYYYE